MTAPLAPALVCLAVPFRLVTSCLVARPVLLKLRPAVRLAPSTSWSATRFVSSTPFPAALPPRAVPSSTRGAPSRRRRLLRAPSRRQRFGSQRLFALVTLRLAAPLCAVVRNCAQGLLSPRDGLGWALLSRAFAALQARRIACPQRGQVMRGPRRRRPLARPSRTAWRSASATARRMHSASGGSPPSSSQSKVTPRTLAMRRSASVPGSFQRPCSTPMM